MKFFFYSLAVAMLMWCAGCRKTDSFINGPDASVYFSNDTLHFDTVFTTTGSVTQLVKIFNQNDRKLKLSTVQLMGGASSAFKLNVDGSPGTSFSNIEIEPNDSIYVFVSVTVNPSSANLPFIVQDSIQVSYNGNNRFIQLDAFGQNANFYRNRRVTTDSTWNNDLPFVILGGLTVDSGVTLTINKGCRIYSHADAPFVCRGNLKVNGEAGDSLRVVFRGDRTDPDYKDLPGSWPGIFFASSSQYNVLNYTTVKNAFQGIISEARSSSAQKIILNQCIIDNITDAGILSNGSSITATNCLISNCGGNLLLQSGNDTFTHCTIATYGSFFIEHKNPVVSMTDANASGAASALTAHFVNCILYGEGGSVNDEVVFTSHGAAGTAISFTHVLYKNESSDIDTSVDTSSLKNASPDFVNIDASRQEFNFHLKPTSPAVNAGTSVGVVIDLDGLPRPDTASSKPDIGCYELQ